MKEFCSFEALFPKKRSAVPAEKASSPDVLERCTKTSDVKLLLNVSSTFLHDFYYYLCSSGILLGI
jgi:hypothetical protein